LEEKDEDENMECEDIDFLEGMEEDENNDLFISEEDPYKSISAFKNIVIDILEKNNLS
jgi:hypothetical protein